jgi:L-alanine-DL-glutamate epimerase-like enolase superfamily enzyme
LRTYHSDIAQRYGITAGKLKVGRDLERDLEPLSVLRAALIEGSGNQRPSLMIDANEFWTPEQAIRGISELEREFDLVWAEEPVRRDDHRGLARVSRAPTTGPWPKPASCARDRTGAVRLLCTRQWHVHASGMQPR